MFQAYLQQIFNSKNNECPAIFHVEKIKRDIKYVAWILVPHIATSTADIRRVVCDIDTHIVNYGDCKYLYGYKRGSTIQYYQLWTCTSRRRTQILTFGYIIGATYHRTTYKDLLDSTNFMCLLISIYCPQFKGWMYICLYNGKVEACLYNIISNCQCFLRLYGVKSRATLNDQGHVSQISQFPYSLEL